MFFCSLSLNVFNIGLQCNLRFLSTTVLQGNVATWVNYGKIFNDIFIANLLLSVMVKEFWRSVRIRQSYGKKIKWHLFSGHGVEPELLPIEVLHCGNRDFRSFCSCDPDLDPMTFIYELDSYPLEINRMCENDFLHEGFRKLSYYRHTYICPRNSIPRRFAVGQIIGL